MTRPFKLSGRMRSVTYAFRGIGIMLASQHNAWIHAFATIVVCAAGIWFPITRHDWMWIILAIVSVWTAEALNTAFEFLADVTNPTHHPVIAKAKDVAAGGVLISAIGAVVIGLLVFGPHLFKLI